MNSAHSDLSHPTVCGQALNKVGGPSFIQACSNYGRINEGGVARTAGWNLACRFVLHAVCCNWDGYQGKARKVKMYPNVLH